VEEPLEMPVGDDVLITGRLDLACKTGNGIEIIDFKVRKRRGLNVLREEQQVQIYAFTANKMKGAKVNGLTLHLLGEDIGNDIQPIAWDDSVVKKTEITIHQACEGIQGGKFPSRPGIHCRFCDFRCLCPFSTAPEKKEEPEDEITMGAEAKKNR
jgi:CRISPR/Cas system-associated exonuclease Cas4 (RecB family)